MSGVNRNEMGKHRNRKKSFIFYLNAIRHISQYILMKHIVSDTRKCFRKNDNQTNGVYIALEKHDTLDPNYKLSVS